MKFDHATPQAGHCTCQKAGRARSRLIVGAIIILLLALQIYTAWAITRLQDRPDSELSGNGDLPLIMVVPVKRVGVHKCGESKSDGKATIGLSTKDEA